MRVPENWGPSIAPLSALAPSTHVALAPLLVNLFRAPCLSLTLRVHLPATPNAKGLMSPGLQVCSQRSFLRQVLRLRGRRWSMRLRAEGRNQLQPGRCRQLPCATRQARCFALTLVIRSLQVSQARRTPQYFARPLPAQDSNIRIDPHCRIHMLWSLHSGMFDSRSVTVIARVASTWSR